MRPLPLLSLVLSTLMVTVMPALGDAPDASESSGVWECPQAGGESLYTNRKVPGCRAIELRQLSVVPALVFAPRPASLGDGAMLPTISLPPVERPFTQTPAGSERTVPDWAKNWYANIAPSGSVREEVCGLYSEWIHLNERTRGGFFFGTDPNYGGDPSGRAQRSSSYPFYDNARYVTLARLFGGGFVPVGCL